MMGIEGKIDPELILVLEHVAIQESLGRCFGDLILWLKGGAPIRYVSQESRVFFKVAPEPVEGRVASGSRRQSFHGRED